MLQRFPLADARMAREGLKPIRFLHRTPNAVRRFAQVLPRWRWGADATIAAAQRFAPQQASHRLASR